MRLNLKATNISLHDDLRAHLDKRLASLSKLIDLEDPAVFLTVELGKRSERHQTGDIFFAEINVYKGKETWRSVVDAPNLNAAIDGMRNEIEGELSSQKGKALSLSRRGGQLAKALLKGGYDGLEYLGRPAKRGWKYLREFRWGRKDTE